MEALGQTDPLAAILERLKRVMGDLGQPQDTDLAIGVAHRAIEDAMHQMEMARRHVPGAFPDVFGAALASKDVENLRHQMTLAAGASMGLFSDKDARISSRLPSRLVEEAMAKSGIANITELVEYALARVATEDDFSERLLKREGSVSKGLDLEF